jgi:rRNA maturation protein Nop10
MEIIKHFSHEHVLSLSEKKREDKVRCEACDEDCDEGVMIYSCRESDCRFNLHESCAKLPQELHNPLLHPHPLSLHPRYGRYFKCNACGETISGASPSAATSATSRLMLSALL